MVYARRARIVSTIMARERASYSYLSQDALDVDTLDPDAPSDDMPDPVFEDHAGLAPILADPPAPTLEQGAPAIHLGAMDDHDTLSRGDKIKIGATGLGAAGIGLTALIDPVIPLVAIAVAGLGYVVAEMRHSGRS